MIRHSGTSFILTVRKLDFCIFEFLDLYKMSTGYLDFRLQGTVFLIKKVYGE